MTADYLFIHAILITMRGNGVGILEDGAVAVTGNRISAVGATKEVLQDWSAHRVIDASGKVVIDVGKKADLLMINMTQPCLSPIILHPVRNVVPNLVYSAKGSEVELVMVDGNILIENFQVLTVDEKQVVRDAQAAVERVCKAAELPFSKIPESRLHRMMQNDEL